ncbi:rRNA N6-adenosine-methyltransferase ZCCHC4 [Acipenser oxyrinchus oxyrinchus]|uniref:rRNA N6-adenosine-methyltransferase ZCCHC4 n=1 Tax=Acipenser oxyrinchus oxyrinchus TaxID=40147 RepID=A0AAD8GJ34_ACIOX|nr:rRNA N6-adenosine-methyltransferase ZCCHC4 [Acipenser oxyrinchus oxyrinchus]
MSEEETLGIEVILNEEGLEKAPSCPHGPTLLFVKASKGVEQGRRFYACSACRDRRDCNFFQWEDEKVSEVRLLAREENNKIKQPPYTHQEYLTRYRQFISLPLAQKRFCRDCQLLLLPDEWTMHTAHQILADVSLAQLRRPSQLLHPLENKKTNAQYLFADRSCHFLLDLFATLGFVKVLCVGTPRLHELIKMRNSAGNNQVMKSLLLDIDFRYSQFYQEGEFCHYNMFNHHFFSGKSAEDVCRTFLLEENNERVVMVTDPPFGGLVKPLAHSFNKIGAEWKIQKKPENCIQEMPMFWIFPYFFESRIKECFPTFTMLDYQVDYENHALYKHGKTGRRQSPVRIFTNLSPGDIVLPAVEGYRFCSLCQRYVSSENKHCDICSACTSKDGRGWKHCSLCNTCVKPSWVHCSACNHCALRDHSCGRLPAGCFICGSTDHKRRACPSTAVPQQNKQRKGKKRNGLQEKAMAQKCTLTHTSRRKKCKLKKKTSR